MSEIIAVILMFGTFAPAPGTIQAPKPATQRISACAVMPRQLVEKYEPNKQLFKYLKPEEEPIGTIGSYCDYGTLGLQVNPFGVTKPSSPGKEWLPVAGVGDGAYFRDNQGRWAEMIVWSGRHHFTLQYSIHAGKSADAMKPLLSEFAAAIIPKLQ